jgi:hypothetical protein
LKRTADPGNGIRKIITFFQGKEQISEFIISILVLQYRNKHAHDFLFSLDGQAVLCSHQLRVLHLQGLGVSIVNDVEYGGSQSLTTRCSGCPRACFLLAAKM